ncbi:MAG: hypothetical protein RL681_293 [Candidatus Parcubacteria bacterium]|jgi:uncharacterized protein involved in tolerance to divalent cations
MIYLNITFKSMEEAEALARELVQRKAAGIVSVAPIKSFYPGEGGVLEREEALLKVTTIDSKVQEVEDIVREKSGGKLPRVISFSLFRIAREYKDWLSSHVG